MDDQKLCVDCSHHRKSEQFRWSTEQERCHANVDLIDIVTGEVLEPMSKSCYDMRYEPEKLPSWVVPCGIEGKLFKKKES